MESSLPPSDVPPQASRQGCFSPVLFIGLYFWLAILNYSRAMAVFFSSDSPRDVPNVSGILLSLGVVAFVGLPLLLVSFLWQNKSYALRFRAVTLAAGLILAYLPIQLFRATAYQTQLLFVLILSAIYGLFLVWALPRWGFSRIRQPNSPRSQAGLWGAVLIGAAGAIPWVRIGALGSPLDTVLALAGSLGVAFVTAQIITALLNAVADSPDSSSTAGTFFLNGLTVSAILLLAVGGLGFAFGGIQLLLLLAVPVWAWAIVAVSGRHPSRKLPVIILVTFLLAAPLLFIDPDELAFVIAFGPGELLGWAFQAAGTALLMGLIASILSLVLSPRSTGIAAPGSRRSVLLLAPVALVALLGLGFLYAQGQPGFYGERMLVILKSQADLSSAPSQADPGERRAWVYQTLVEHAQDTQADLRASLDQFGIDYTPYYLVNAIEVSGSPLLRAWLSTQAEVDRILDSPRLRPLPEPLTPSPGTEAAPEGPQWNLTQIGADRVWSELGVTGEGIVVGQSDSGVQGDHPMLADRYRGHGGQNDYNWYDPWNGSAAPVDFGGHGTHTLGSILGGNTGVAPGATWFACANLARNLGSPALYLDCMQFMLAPFPQNGDAFTQGDPSLGANVINNSWGCPDVEGCDPQSLQPAVDALRQAGIFVVASAGNDGPGCETLNAPPALYDSAYSVGALDRFGNLADFSSLGPVAVDGSDRIKPDISAPGVDILSTLPNSTYGSFSGTSMAGPHVVGVVALMWSANPSLIGDIEQTEAILNRTAKAYTGTLPNCPAADQLPSSAYGYGMVDAFAAVQAALAVP